MSQPRKIKPQLNHEGKPLTHAKCVHCGKRIPFDEWNHNNDEPAHRRCANRQVRVWPLPLGVHDMVTVWAYLKKGKPPERRHELVESVLYTIQHDRALPEDGGGDDWYCSRRRKMYARKLLNALYNYNRGIRPEGRFTGG